MTSFALAIWAWQVTGSAQALAMVGVFTYAPLLIVTPFVGYLVDRLNRKWVMALSDLGAALSTSVILIFYLTGRLQIWHVYAATAFASAFQAFQWPAYSAAVSLMIPKKHYNRASGLISMVQNASNILGPILAGALVGSIGVGGIMVIDLMTFGMALLSLFLVFIPQPKKMQDAWTLNAFLNGVTFGFNYIFKRPGLLGLQLIFFAGNFMTVIGWAVVSPMVLARTGGDAAVLGLVQSSAAIGGVSGGALLALWGGPKKLVVGVFLGWMLSGLLGRFLMGVTIEPVVWMVSAFLLAFFMPFANGSNQAIWQRKVPPEIQGRVFSARRFIAQLTIPISMGLSGWLADHVFEPAFATNQAWGSLSMAWVLAPGAGAGYALMIALSGLLVSLVGVLGWLFPAVRRVETDLPDFDASEENTSPPEGESHLSPSEVSCDPH